jgi:hypothetical protein
VAAASRGSCSGLGQEKETHMPTPQQIKKSAQWVIENFGPESGLPRFSYDAESVAYLDSFIDRQGESFRGSEQSTNKIVSLLGAFLGEAIIGRYGGEWQQTSDGISLRVPAGGQLHVLQPFHKVHKRLMNGPEDSLHYYFATFLPQVFSAPESRGSQSSSPPGRGEKKPWWKIF